VSGPLGSIRIRGFRSAHDVTLEPGPITAFLGAAGSGKSNLLLAIWKLLAADAPPLEPGDASEGLGQEVEIEATLASGAIVRLVSARGGSREQRSGTPPPALFLPAAQRADRLVAEGTAVPEALERALQESPAAYLALLPALERWLEQGSNGLVLLIEEPELFLRPHAQRALFRLLHEFAGRGNQVLYSTHAASFLNVSRLDELALVDRDATGVTRIRRPRPLSQAEAFRALSEFDAERSELLLARAALLVEGRTEKLVFPFLFRALGYDPDREGISIVECGGKPNIPIIAEVCNAVGIPYLVVHDRDAAPGRRPIPSEVAANEAIERVAGAERTVELARDFEAVARLHGHRHKPERALHWFALARSEADVPEQLASVVRRTVALARESEPST
jgi:predicted ATP-dependent endonuclease of OLD family